MVFIGEFSLEEYAETAIMGVTLPRQGVIYAHRAILTDSITGQRSLYLKQIINPVVAWRHPIIGVLWREMSFGIDNFTQLDGTPLAARKPHYEDFVDLPSPQYIITCFN